MRKSPRENPIVTRSRAALIGAATRLLEDREPSDISIKDVVEESGMSRPTFYQHFPDLGSLFATAGLARLAEAFSRVDASGLEPATSPQGLTALFDRIVTQMSEHAAFFYRIQSSQGGATFHAGAVAATATRLQAEPLLAERAGDDEALWEFLAAGVVWTITRHLATVCQNPRAKSHPASDLARILTAVLASDPTPATTKRHRKRSTS